MVPPCWLLACRGALVASCLQTWLRTEVSVPLQQAEARTGLQMRLPVVTRVRSVACLYCHAGPWIQEWALCVLFRESTSLLIGDEGTDVMMADAE